MNSLMEEETQDHPEPMDNQSTVQDGLTDEYWSLYSTNNNDAQ